MRMWKWASMTFFVGVVTVASGYCPIQMLSPLEYVVEHATWRGWHQALIYTPRIEPGCEWAVIRLMKCLSVNGVASTSRESLKRRQSTRIYLKLGIAVLVPHIKPNATKEITKLIEQLVEMEMNTASYDWIFVMRSDKDFQTMNDILNASSIRFDQFFLVAYPFYHQRHLESRHLGLCDHNFIYETKKSESSPRRPNSMRSRHFHSNNNSCRYVSQHPMYKYKKTEYERSYYRATDRFKNLTRVRSYKRSGNVFPLFQSGILYYNYSKGFDMMNVSKFSLKREAAKWNTIKSFYGVSQGIHLIQYFKVRANSTLYANFLGSWSRELSMSQVEPPYPVEARNFLGEELVVGRCNYSREAAGGGDDDEPAAPASLDDVLHYFTVRLNTTSVTRYYSKLGFRSFEGAWTGLLGALLEHAVDLALEPVTAHPPRHQDMDFIFPIAETMCNIYIRQQETSTVRDIFMAPFSARLVVCVVAVAVVAAVAVVVISRLTPPSSPATRAMGYTEALIWSTGILCQQGGSWTPPTPAASVLLIVCLLFAVVTYNAYAAFITSVLSVRVASLDTVAAVLHSPDFKIGYIRNGADQMYLMSTKDVQLNAFYIRGYSDAENLVSSAEEGLARAARQDYAFFANQRIARTTLRSLSQARGRCAVRELPVHSTRAQLAIPLPHRSPYSRPILVGLLQLRSSGALDRLEAALVPAMPHCAPPLGFASARATDVRSALLLLLVGLIAASLIGIGEYSWKNRRKLLSFFTKSWQRLVNLISNW